MGEEFLAKNTSLDVLICNAGTGFTQRAYTEDGYELNFQVNYLGHLFLMIELLPLMKMNENGCVIINVVCSCYTKGSLDLFNIQGQTNYSKSKMLANAKLFQMMSMGFLERRLKATNVASITVNPGLTYTPIFKSMEESQYFRYVQKIKTWFGNTSLHSIQESAGNVINIAAVPFATKLRGLYFEQGTATSIVPAARKRKDQEV